MNYMIESQVFKGEMYIKASDHHRAVSEAVAAERTKTEHLVKEMLYIVEAFNRGCNSEDYFIEIGEVIENAREWLEVNNEC